MRPPVAHQPEAQARFENVGENGPREPNGHSRIESSAATARPFGKTSLALRAGVACHLDQTPRKSRSRRGTWPTVAPFGAPNSLVLHPGARRRSATASPQATNLRRSAATSRSKQKAQARDAGESAFDAMIGHRTPIRLGGHACDWAGYRLGGLTSRREVVTRRRMPLRECRRW